MPLRGSSKMRVVAKSITLFTKYIYIYIVYIKDLIEVFCHKENQRGKSTEVADGESRIKELSSLAEELNASASCLGELALSLLSLKVQIFCL